MVSPQTALKWPDESSHVVAMRQTPFPVVTAALRRLAGQLNLPGCCVTFRDPGLSCFHDSLTIVGPNCSKPTGL